MLKVATGYLHSNLWTIRLCHSNHFMAAAATAAQIVSVVVLNVMVKFQRTVDASTKVSVFKRGWGEKESPAINPKHFTELRSPTNGEQ